MPSTNSCAESSAKLAAEELNRLERLICTSPAIPGRVWNRVFTKDDRNTLQAALIDSPEIAGSPLLMWQRLSGESGSRCVVTLARRLGLISECDANWLLDSLGETFAQPTPARHQRIPEWNGDILELTFNGIVVRKLRSRGVARNVSLILDVFEEEHWPPRIDDPHSGSPNSQRLHATIRSLNNGLLGIKFHSDGSGSGVVWKPVG